MSAAVWKGRRKGGGGPARAGCLGLALLLAACAGAPSYQLRFATDAEGRARVIATGPDLRSSPLAPPDPGAAASAAAPWLSVHVVRDGEPAPRPMLGDWTLEGAALVFTPRFDLRPGMTYRAVLRAPPGADGDGAVLLVRDLTVPAADATPVATVTAVYPSTDVLPENQLKFYVHFSAPMSRGRAYRHVHLLDGGGEEVPAPFLEIQQELWDPDCTRLTLLLDPGRVKQGLTPREELGPVLEDGRTYTLVIDASWPDQQGRPLVKSHRKAFRAGPVDDVQPSTSRWKLHPPPAGTLQPLVVVFDEPLDHALLQRLLVVTDARGAALPGRVEVDEQERRWQFHPQREWSDGRHELLVETALEDLAGNSIRRPFERDVFVSMEPSGAPGYERVPFDVPASAGGH